MISEIDIGLYNKKFTTGSFIKLYSYEMPKGAIHEGLYQEFNQLLYKPALPFWLIENRDKYIKRQKKDRAVYGNYVRIFNSNEQILEIKPIYEKLVDSRMGEVTLQVVVFKKGLKAQQQQDRTRRFIGTGRNVVYSLNGQVQGNEGQSFITQDLKFRFLKDSTLIVIDCSMIKTNFRQDLFMANRSNLKQSNKLDYLREKVIETLRNNTALKNLNTQRKNSILHGGDDREEKELIQNLLSKVPLDDSLTSLLMKGFDSIELPKDKKLKTKKKGKEQKVPKETKRFPSIFKVNVKEQKESGKKIKSIPLNGKGIINFETDVMEDYFYRPQEKGEFQIKVLEGKTPNDSINPDPKPSPFPTKVEDYFEINQSGPMDGSIKLMIKPKSELSVGDEVKLNARLTSPEGDLESIFYVKIVNPQKEENKKVEQEPERPQLPRLIKISKKDNNWIQDNGEIWSENNWDENSVINIIPSEETKTISAIAINMDSYTLKRLLSKNKVASEDNVHIIKNEYISKVYLHGLFLYAIMDKLNIQENEMKSLPYNSEEFVAQIFKNYSDVLLYLDTNKEILNSFDA